MDEADIANDRAEQELSRALSIRKPTGPVATGQCLWCGDGVAPTVRWCGADCRDFWQRAHAAR